MTEPVSKTLIKKGTKGIFTSRVKMKFRIRVVEDAPVGSARVHIEYEQSRDKAHVPVNMLELEESTLA
jgi:hypothetical protein